MVCRKAEGMGKVCQAQVPEVPSVSVICTDKFCHWTEQVLAAVPQRSSGPLLPTSTCSSHLKSERSQQALHHQTSKQESVEKSMTEPWDTSIGPDCGICSRHWPQESLTASDSNISWNKLCGWKIQQNPRLESSLKVHYASPFPMSSIIVRIYNLSVWITYAIFPRIYSPAKCKEGPQMSKRLQCRWNSFLVGVLIISMLDMISPAPHNPSPRAPIKVIHSHV